MGSTPINRYTELRLLAFGSPYRRILSGANATSGVQHPSCGDILQFTARIEGGVVIDISFSGAGCILSQASAALVAEYVHRKNIADLRCYGEDDLLQSLGLALGPTRRLCVLLAHEALQKLVVPVGMLHD